MTAGRRPAARGDLVGHAQGQPVPSEAWLAELDTERPVAGLAGPGRWLIARYVPTALFSLKASTATSSVGKTLVVPTPYAIKMALVDAGFRSGLPESDCAELLASLVPVGVRISPPESAIVTQTFVKIRQEPKNPNPMHPYTASIAYREVVFHQGTWRWAFDLGHGDEGLAERIAYLAPRISYIGKRGSFVQFDGLERAAELSTGYTVPMPPPGDWVMPARWHPAKLDDFGPEASLEVLSTFSAAKPRVGRHRRYVDTIVPLGLVSTGPGFSEYRED